MAVFNYPTVSTLGMAPVPFQEAKEGSQDCAISSKAQVYKTIWKVPWDLAEQAKTVLLGFTQAVAADLTHPAYFARLLPHAHPKAPWLFATDVLRTEGREPLGGAAGRDTAGMATYKWAFLYVQYTKLFCNVLPDNAPAMTVGHPFWPDESTLARFVRKRRRSQLTFQSNRRGSWKWLDAPRVVALPIPWRIPLLRLQLTWMGIPIANLDEGTINDTIGTTNSLAIAGYRAGSLLLNGADWPDYFPIPGHSGLQVDVTFDVLYFPPILGGPNFFPDPERGNTYHEIGVPGALPGGGPMQPFPKRDWSAMFQPINI